MAASALWAYHSTKSPDQLGLPKLCPWQYEALTFDGLCTHAAFLEVLTLVMHETTATGPDRHNHHFGGSHPFVGGISGGRIRSTGYKIPTGISVCPHLHISQAPRRAMVAIFTGGADDFRHCSSNREGRDPNQAEIGKGLEVTSNSLGP